MMQGTNLKNINKNPRRKHNDKSKSDDINRKESVCTTKVENQVVFCETIQIYALHSNTAHMLQNFSFLQSDPVQLPVAFVVSEPS